MKLIITLFVCVSFFIFSYSQELYDKQEFNIQNIKIDTIDDAHFKLGISLRFDVEFKYAIEDFTYDEYKISALLKDKSGKLIYNNSENFIKVSAKPDFSNKKNVIEKAVYLFIPISDINLTSGKHQISLELNAVNKSVSFKNIFSQNIEYIKPKLYDYSEQELKIQDFTANAGKRTGQNGININLDCFYKYASQLIKSNYTADGAHYYFYVTMYDKNNNLVFSPSEDISNYRLSEYDMREALIPNIKDEISLFISNRKLNLPEGKHNLKVYLNVTNKKQDIVFKDIATTSIEVTQEPFYIVETNISNLKIVYSDNYDVANVFGQIFSKRSKNKGRGYPDVYWKITTGYDYIYSSGVVDNAFYGLDGSTIFRITDSDPVWFEIYDFDKISQNDFIASYKIDHPKGNYILEKENFKYKNIESVDLKFTKQKQASIYCNDISFQNNKANGISGVDILFSYQAKDVSNNSNIKVSPFWVDTLMQDREINHYSQIKAETSTETPAFIISSANNNGSLKMHIPYYELQTGAKIGFKAELMNYNLQIASIVSSKTITIPEINDIGFSILKIEEAKQNGVYGVEYTTAFDIPSEYRTNVGRSNMDFETKLINIKDNSDFSDYSINTYDAIANTNKGFIPFSKLKDFNSELNISVDYIASIKASKLNVGHGSKDFYIKKPELEKIDLYQISLKYNTKEIVYETLKIVIIHGQDIVYESPAIAVAKKMNYENLPDIVAHNMDDITIKFIGLDSFKQETELSTNYFQASGFINKSSLKLKSDFPIKKPKLILKK